MRLPGSTDESHLSLIKHIGFNPVFIMGLHRSGTSILYHLLASTGHFNAVTVFHLVHRDRLLHLHLNPPEKECVRRHIFRWFEERNLQVRSYDSIPVGPDDPEEYGYALQCRGVKPKVTPRNFESFATFARKIQYVEDVRRPLLLKNPWDTDNFMTVQRLMPEARFIFIHRDPLSVVSSQLSLAGGLIQKPSDYEQLIDDKYRRFCESPVIRGVTRAICSDALPVLLWRICQSVVRGCDYMVNNVGSLGDRATSLTYAQLCDNPNASMRRLLQFLNLDCGPGRDYSSLVRHSPRPLHPKVERIKRRIELATEAYREMFGV